MARAKLVIENELTGALQGTLLSDDDCVRLDRIIELNEEKGFVSDLKNIIYTLDSSTVDDIISRKTNFYVSEEDMVLGELTDLQTVGTAFMYTAKRCILGDSVGMGKTAEVMALHALLARKYAERGDDFRTLVFTEKAIAPQFRREAVKFTGDYFGELSSTTQLDNFLDDHGISNFYRDLENGDVEDFEVPEPFPNLICGHHVAKSARFQEFLLSEKEYTGRYPYDLVIIDESGSVLGSTKSDIYKALHEISKYAEYVILLNATSFESALSKFYSQLNFVDPTFLPTKTVFEKRYCKMQRRGAYSVPTGEYKNQEEFRGKVRYRYMARTRKTFGSRFEGCTSSLLLLDKSPEQKKFITIASYPQMVYDNPSFFDKDMKFHQGNPKVGALYNLITGKAQVEGNWGTARTVLIYCHYKETMRGLARILNAKGITTHIMNGDTSAEDRAKLISGFQNGTYRVLITNVMKGLNFGKTNHIIAYSVPGNVNQMVQFEGRATRDFDIIDKHLAVLCTKGEEYTRFKKILKQRATDSDIFAGSDNSLVLSLLFQLDTDD